ncbi:MAG: hypothetical protein WBF77_05820 [Sulfurimonadaceae bacterium]
MKYLLTMIILIMQVQAASLIESLQEKSVPKAVKSFEYDYSPLSEDEKRLNVVAGTQKRAVNSVSIKLIEKKISEGFSIAAAYTPPFKHGDILDNKENTEITLAYTF